MVVEHNIPYGKYYNYSKPHWTKSFVACFKGSNLILQFWISPSQFSISFAGFERENISFNVCFSSTEN